MGWMPVASNQLRPGRFRAEGFFFPNRIESDRLHICYFRYPRPIERGGGLHVMAATCSWANRPASGVPDKGDVKHSSLWGAYMYLAILSWPVPVSGEPLSILSLVCSVCTTTIEVWGNSFYFTWPVQSYLYTCRRSFLCQDVW